jgi:hypothetical protein
MSTNPTTGTSTASAPPTPPPQGSSTRLGILLLLLVVAIAAMGYDFGVAGPGVAAADKKIHEHVDESNKKSVKDSGPVTPAEIQKLIGSKPTWTDKHPDEQYEVEYYCWRGPLPVINMQKHYLAVVYINNKYSSHYMNEQPPMEALPIEQKPAEITDEAVEMPTTSGGERKKDGEAKSGEGEGKSEGKLDDGGAPAEGKTEAKPEGGEKKAD